MIQEFEQIRVLIAYDGVVHWEPGGVFMTTCDIHILYFPFDMQACQIELGNNSCTLHHFATSPPGGVRSIVMSMSA